MQEKDPILRERELDGYRSIAQKIRNRLQQLENANDKDKRRWVWELLQNAIDAGDKKSVDINIVVEPAFISFQHNGGYFLPRSVTNLVHQISSKEGTQSIGRFGTGFLTTHTLSREVVVESSFKSNDKFYPFKLQMDRTGKTEAELVLGIEKTWDLYNSISKQVLLQPTPTTFQYLRPNLEIAQATLRDAMDFMAYCFAFVPLLNTFSVENHLHNAKVSYRRKNKVALSPYLSVLSFEKITESQTDEIQLLYADNGQISLAIGIQSEGGQTTVLPITANTPRLFCAYPLIGTETFYFPLVLNSLHFNPKTERDKLYLKGNTPDAMVNKQLLLETLLLYEKVVDHMITQRWKDIWRIVPNALPPKDDDLDRDWYDNHIYTYMKNILLGRTVVENEAGKLEQIRTCFFPNHEKEAIRTQIWEFAVALMPHQLPAKRQIQAWYEITKEWTACEPLLLTLEKLAQKVASYSKIAILMAYLRKTETEILLWLNDFIGFIESQQSLLLERYAILPNQKGDFCVKNALFEDKDKVEEVLKTVLFQLGDDWRKEYLHTAITKANMRGKVRWRYNIIQAINTVLDRNENYRFTDITKQKLVERGIRPQLLLGLQNLVGQVFHKKETYLTKLRLVLGAELPLYEKIILDNSIAAEMRKAVSMLVPLYNATNDTLVRKTFYEIAKTFDKTIGDRIQIATLPLDTWAKADKWLLQAIITDIENGKQLSVLARMLQLSEQQSLELLNKLFIFIVTHGKIEVLTDKTVYPNQNGLFCKKMQLFEDENLPAPLKIILKDLETLVVPTQLNKGWEHLLLHPAITAFNSNYKFLTKNLKELSTRINDLLRNIPKHANTAHRDVVLRLLAIGKSVDEKQQTIWAFSKILYGNKVPEPIILLKNADNLDISECLDWVMTRLVIDIEGNQFVETLQKELFGDVNAMEWLNQVIEFVQKDAKWKHLLDDYAIIPNQNEDFCKLSALYLDDEIPVLLKKIIKSLNYDWVGELAHEKIYLNLPANKQRTKADAAAKINRWFKNYQESKQDPIFVGAWRNLQQYFKQEKNDYIRNYFDWIWLHKAEITLATLGNDEDKEHVFQIIESGRVAEFAKLAQVLSEKDMNELLENPQKYQAFKAWEEHTKKMQELAKNAPTHNDLKEDKNTGMELASKFAILKELSAHVGINFESWEKLVEELKKAHRKINFAQVPPPSSTPNAGVTMDWAAIAKANEDAQIKLYAYLATPEAQAEGYDRSGWQAQHSIITGVKRSGLNIKMVIKGAKNGTVYFDNTKKEQKVLKERLAELWVYDGKDLFSISVGDIIHIWNMIGIKTYMFDFKKA